MNSSGKRHTSVDARLARLATRQHGVVCIDQLRGLGMSDNEIAYRVRIGRLHRLHRGVYAVGHLNFTDRSTFIAAVFAVGKGAVLSHVAAATLHGFMEFRGGPIDVTLPRRARHRTGIRVHFAAVVDRTTRRGIRVTTPARTLLDVSRSEPRKVARRAVNQALVDRRVTIPMLYREAAGPRGARLRRLLADASPTRSELEDVTVEFLRRHGVQFESNFVLDGWEVDFWIPERNLVIEVDGARFHDNALQRASDEAKRRALEAAGFRVQRLRWKDLFCAPPTILAA